MVLHTHTEREMCFTECASVTSLSGLLVCPAVAETAIGARARSFLFRFRLDSCRRC